MLGVCSCWFVFCREWNGIYLVLPLGSEWIWEDWSIMHGVNGYLMFIRVVLVFLGLGNTGTER